MLLEVSGGDNRAHVAQLVEHILGKDEVSGSIPLVGSSAQAAETTETINESSR
jgi:hypothetical protein